MKDMVDWISRLPDDVLNRILSRLTTKEVVQTCVLSKRWRNTWASVPVLNFKLGDFHNDCDRFGRFVDSVFQNRVQSCLRKLIYEGEFKDAFHGPSIEWLNRAALLMPRTIKFSISLTSVASVDAPLIIPDSVFSCKSLKYLVLSVQSFPVKTIIRSKSIALPSLRTLVLRHLSLDDDFVQKLFLGCFPSLKYLVLSVQPFPVKTTIRPKSIALPSLQSLVLRHLSSLDDDFVQKLFLGCCPSLKYLELSVQSVHVKTIISPKSIALPSLQTLRLRHLILDDDFAQKLFLGCCPSLKYLELSVQSVPVKTIIIPKSIALPSLQTLRLDYLSIDDDFAQKLFLGGCPSLKYLTLEYCDLFISDISSNVLKELSVRHCCQYQHMRICCPSLITLSISSHENSIRSISLEKLTSLVNAQIRLNGNDEKVDVNDLPDAKLLSGLSNATSLEFYLRDPDLKEHWKKDITKCRTFRNLKRLEIKDRHMINNFDLIACFLEHSPLLQKLTLNWLSTENYLNRENMMYTEQDISFLVRQLIFIIQRMVPCHLIC